MSANTGFSWGIASVILAAGIAAVFVARASPLDTYHQRYNPVLVFTPSIKDIRLDEQTRRLRDHEIAFKERAMIVVTIAGNEPLIADETLAPQAGPDALRRQFGVDDKTFAVILLDKKGNEIFRHMGGVIDGSKLVEQIDILTTKRNREKWG